MNERDEEKVELAEEQQNDVLGKLLRLAGGRPAVPEEAAARIKSATYAHWKRTVRKQSQKRFFFSLSGAIAASLLLYLLAWQYVNQYTEQPYGVAIAETLAGNVFVTNAGGDDSSHRLSRGGVVKTGTTVESDGSGRILLRLLQGITVRMDVDTRIRFKSDSELVLDRGAVYLDCGESANPIHLITSLGTITDQGTQFEVRMDAQNLRIRVREGAVLMQQQGISRTVEAGKQLTVSTAGNASFGEVSSFGPDWQWVSSVAPVYHLEGRSLMDFLNWVTRENGWALHFSDPAISAAAPGITLHGSIRGLNPDQMPEAVLPVCGLTYTLRDGILSVKPGKRS